MTAREAICAALPPLSAHVLASHVIAFSGLPYAVAWGNLAILCCENKATVADEWVARGRQIQSRRKIVRRTRKNG
jgi:hypothetical protein